MKSSDTLEIALFGIAGFLAGFLIFTMWWTTPLKNSPHRRKTARNPVFWYLSISVGLVTALAFCGESCLG
jgi:hypothetical protein